MSFAKRVPIRVKPSLYLLQAGLLLCWVTVGAQTAPHGPAPPTADEIALRVNQRNLEQAAALKAYVSRRVMTLTYKGILADKHASETVEMSYTEPATKRFTVLSSSGSALLRDSVFQREMTMEAAAATDAKAKQESAFTPANYALRLLGEEKLPEGDCYVLEVSPRTQSPYGYAGKVWVQSAEFAIVRIQARPVEDPSFWVRDGEFTSEFEKVGNFWLPRKTVSSSHIRLGGNATFSIEFGPYRVVNAEPFGGAGTP